MAAMWKLKYFKTDPQREAFYKAEKSLSLNSFGAAG